MRKRSNLLWGVIAVAIALMLLLNALNVIPSGLYDILTRAWSVLLVFLGLLLLLRRRLPLGELVAFGLSAALVAGVAVYAFSTRAEQQREDNIQPVAQTIGQDVTLVVLRLDVLSTDVELRVTQGESREIRGEFVGSLESDIVVNYFEVGEGRAEFTLQESRPNPFPILESVGRGELTLQLPEAVGVDILVNTQRGLATLDLSAVDLERLTLNVQDGDAVVTLPEYAPRSPNATDQPGSLTVLDGNLTLLIPEEVGARLELNRGGSGIEPQFDETRYNRLFGDVLETRNIDDMPIVLPYVVNVPRGLIRVEEAP